jgi:hypothetical protein
VGPHPRTPARAGSGWHHPRVRDFQTVEAALNRDDLVYIYDVAKPPYGRVVIIPLSALRFR